MKTNSFLFFSFFLTLLIVSCSGNDNSSSTDDESIGDLEAQRLLTITTLTGDDERMWFIQTANLTNANGTFDISNQYNIKDDEFIFSGDLLSGNLEWRPGYDINLEATSVAGTAKDYYLGPKNYSFHFTEDSPNQLTSIDNLFSFTVTDNQTITGVIRFPSQGGELALTLIPKTTVNYTTPPSSGLNFSFIGSIEDSSLFNSDTAGGMIGSYSDNSLFLVSRNDYTDQVSEQILKYNIDTNIWTTNLYPQLQFVTKRLNIINNELVVFGGEIVSTYPLQPNGAPTREFRHDLRITRFGFTVQDNLGYFVGNEMGFRNQPAKIRSYNYLTNEINQITTLPKPRVYGAAEIVNNDLYVFGGRTNFPTQEYTDLDAECFKVNITTGDITSFHMPELATLTFAAKKENLIYVAYETRIDADGDGVMDNDDRNIHFAVYDTQNDTFEEIPHNLDDSDLYTSITAITIFNGKLYAAIVTPTPYPHVIRIFSAPL